MRWFPSNPARDYKMDTTSLKRVAEYMFSRVLVSHTVRTFYHMTTCWFRNGPDDHMQQSFNIMKMQDMMHARVLEMTVFFSFAFLDIFFLFPSDGLSVHVHYILKSSSI